jgi:shikimate 5-dehydrogenase
LLCLLNEHDLPSSIEELMMRVGIVGTGAVGSACALALVMRGAVREVVLVDRTRERARAVATDIRYGAPLSPLIDIWDGDFDELAGAALVMVTAGVNEKGGGAIDRGDAAGRLKLLDIHRAIYESLITRTVEAAQEAVILVGRQHYAGPCAARSRAKHRHLPRRLALSRAPRTAAPRLTRE